MNRPPVALEPSPPKRQSSVRRSCDLEAICWECVEIPVGLPAKVRTLSLGGLSLVLSVVPQPVPFLTVDLVNRRRGTSRRFRVRVLYTLFQDAEGCVVGASFPGGLREEELAVLVS